jgi:hypothetical protein
MNPEPAVMVSHKSPIATTAVRESVGAATFMSTMVGPTEAAASTVVESCPTVPVMMSPTVSFKPSPSPMSVKAMAAEAAPVTSAKMMSRMMTDPFVFAAESATLTTISTGSAMLGPAACEFTMRAFVPRPSVVAATRIAIVAFSRRLAHPHRAARSADGTLPRATFAAFRNLFVSPEISSTAAARPRSVISGAAISKSFTRTRTIVAPIGFPAVSTRFVATSITVVVSEIAPGFTSLVIQLIRTHFVRRRSPVDARRELQQSGCRDSAKKKKHVIPHDKNALRLTRCRYFQSRQLIRGSGQP